MESRGQEQIIIQRGDNQRRLPHAVEKERGLVLNQEMCLDKQRQMQDTEQKASCCTTTDILEYRDCIQGSSGFPFLSQCLFLSGSKVFFLLLCITQQEFIRSSIFARHAWDKIQQTIINPLNFKHLSSPVDINETTCTLSQATMACVHEQCLIKLAVLWQSLPLLLYLHTVTHLSACTFQTFQLLASIIQAVFVCF